MAYQDGSSKEYAPGVSNDGESCRANATFYSGKAEALIACGLISQAWLPGMPGNGKTMQSVVILQDGTAKLLPARSRFESFDIGFGGVYIRKSGATYHVRRYWTKDELAKKMAEEREAEKRETWLAAIKARDQSDFPRRWKEGVLHHVIEAEKLIDGRLVFTDFPDVGLAEKEIESAKCIIAELKNLLSWVTPAIKNKVQTRSNVFSLNDAAFRNMRKH